MIITLNDEQMLALWRAGAGLEPAFLEASIERYDSVDITGLLRRAMRAWYIDYLKTAPIEMAPVTNLTQYARISAGAVAEEWTLSLTCQTARIVDIEIEGVGHPALINPDDPKNDELLRTLTNRFVRCGSCPKGIYRPQTDTVTIYLDHEPEIREVRGVMITGDEIFTVDERVLAEIPALARKVIFEEEGG